jgi:hypothetical protein
LIGILILLGVIVATITHPEWLAVYASWIFACVLMGVIVGLYHAVRDTRW